MLWKTEHAKVFTDFFCIVVEYAGGSSVVEVNCHNPLIYDEHKYSQ